MSTPPPLSLPREGERIRGDTFAYVKRASSVRQAAAWNEQLAGDPVLGPGSGFVVGVGPRMDGRFPLVWVRA